MSLRAERIGARGAFWPVFASLLSVAQQHLVAGPAQFRTMLLQTGENGEITLIDHLAAETGDITRAGALFRRSPAMRLLGLRHRDGRTRCEKQNKRCKNLRHCIPSFQHQRIPSQPGQAARHSDNTLYASPHRMRSVPAAVNMTNVLVHQQIRYSTTAKSTGKCGQIYDGEQVGSRASDVFPRRLANQLKYID